MSKTTADERLQLDGELSAEALAILAELSENEIDTGMIETLDLAQLPEGLTEEWTVGQLKEVLADAALERSVSDLLSRARLESSLTLAEVGERLGVSRARVSQLEHPDANLELKTLMRLADALDYDVVLALKPRTGTGQPIAAELRP
jgi:DNA-directed RNA polymerase specialized sigma subunit